MNIYKVITVHSRSHVLKEQTKSRMNSIFPDANYLGTGLCLCGILKKGETLEDYKVRINKLKPKKDDSRSKKNRNDHADKSG